MASPFTVRLDEETRRRITRIARKKRTTASKMVREVLTTWVNREDQSLTPYEQIKDLIGSVRGGDPKLSQDVGRKYSEALKARRNRR